MLNFTKRQWSTLIVIGIADFCNAICVSLQAPFYPQEAEKKGCTATEYGLVFGIFELIVFLVSPIYGQHLNKIGPKLTFNGGIYTTGICAFLFGLLDRVQGHLYFIVLSFVIRIIEAIGNAAFLTASFALIAKEFPDNVAVTFAFLETFFGLGLIVGPTVGGALFQVGGYTLPFAVMGFTLFLSAILAAIVLPKHYHGVDKEKGESVLCVLKIPGIILAATSTITTSMSIGFLQATLEPHLRQFSLSPMILGVMFVINGGVYALTTPFFGWLCDSVCHPKYVTVSGTILVALGFSLIGPLPFITSETLLWLTIIGLIFHGMGIAAQLVASFSDALGTCIAYGFPNNLDTFGLISGLWTSSFALGAFIGPSVSGILYDHIGFKQSSLFIVITHLIIGILVTVFMLCCHNTGNFKKLKEDNISKVESDFCKPKSLQNSVTESMKSIKSVGNGISIEQSRPLGMNSLIACNSYKTHAWPNKDINIVTQTQSYGTIECSSTSTPCI